MAHQDAGRANSMMPNDVCLLRDQSNGVLEIITTDCCLFGISGGGRSEALRSVSGRCWGQCQRFVCLGEACKRNPQGNSHLFPFPNILIAI
eukprot:scaffold217907_cov21-Prasinocladus_malaysianus.AAC.1